VNSFIAATHTRFKTTCLGRNLTIQKSATSTAKTS